MYKTVSPRGDAIRPFSHMGVQSDRFVMWGCGQTSSSHGGVVRPVPHMGVWSDHFVRWGFSQTSSSRGGTVRPFPFGDVSGNLMTKLCYIVLMQNLII